MNVDSLDAAHEAYYAAKSQREEQAAYHEILLFGGKDGYRQGWRSTLAQWARRFACWIEK